MEVPNPIAHQAVLIEEQFNLQPEITCFHKCFSDQKVPFVPLALAQSPCSDDGDGGGQVPIYIPTIPRMIDALLCQVEWREKHSENFPSRISRPRAYVGNFIRYLHLEDPRQSEKLLPALADSNRCRMEARLAKFKRKPTVTLESISNQNLPK